MVAACIAVVVADLFVAVADSVGVAAVYLLLILPLLVLTALPLLMREHRKARAVCRAVGALLIGLGGVLAVAGLFLLVVPGVLLLAASVREQQAPRG